MKLAHKVLILVFIVILVPSTVHGLIVHSGDIYTTDVSGLQFTDINTTVLENQ